MTREKLRKKGQCCALLNSLQREGFCNRFLQMLQQVSTDVGESSKKIPRKETSGKKGRNNIHHKGNKNWVDNNHSNSETTLYEGSVAMELNANLGAQHGYTEIEVDYEISFKQKNVSSSSGDVENTSDEFELSPNTKIDTENLELGWVNWQDEDNALF